MKKGLVLAFVFSCFLIVPQQIKAQSLEDYYNAGYILGASIRQAVDNRRARQAEQERIEREREEADRAYRLEQQRIANERYAAEQAARAREAEAKRAEEERLRIAEETRRAEEERIRIAEEAEAERLRLAREAESAKLAENAIIENREYNDNVQILSSNNSIKFLTDEGETIYLNVMFHGMGEGSYLSFTNRSNKRIRLSCNKVNVRVKYEGDDREQTFSDACSIVMPPHSENSLEWSDVFFGISETETIESIKLRFVETQVREDKDRNQKVYSSPIKKIDMEDWDDVLSLRIDEVSNSEVGSILGTYIAKDDVAVGKLTLFSDFSFLLVVEEEGKEPIEGMGTYSIDNNISRGEETHIELFIQGESKGRFLLKWQESDDSIYIVIDNVPFIK